MAHLINIDKVIKKAGTLLTLPDICLQLKKLVDDPDSSASDLAKLIAKDPALTARLLKIANSSLYYFPKQITSVAQAITLLGTQQLYNLALATSAAAIIRTAGGGYLELKTLWKHSVYSALLAQIIFSEKGSNADNLFVSGLLSNIGTLAVVQYSPEIAMNALGGCAKNQQPWQREEEVLGFSMAEASGGLLQAWNLPNEIVIPVRHQNQPDKAESHVDFCNTLHIATRLASEMLKEELSNAPDFRNSIAKGPMDDLGIVNNDLDSFLNKTAEIAPEMLMIFTL